MDIEVFLGNKIQFSRYLPHPEGIIRKKTYPWKPAITIKMPLSFPTKKILNYKENSSSSSSEDEDDDNYADIDEESLNSANDDNNNLDNDNSVTVSADQGSSNFSSNNTSNKARYLRRTGLSALTEEDTNLLYSWTSSKKQKKELTDEDLEKKAEQVRLRRWHAKTKLEEEKKEALNRCKQEDGKKWKERERKWNEERIREEKKKRKNIKWH